MAGLLEILLFIRMLKQMILKKLTSGKHYKLSNKGSIGTLDLLVGGSITVAANQPQGDYTGLFTITVSY